MTILVGYPINRRARAVLSLAAMLARSSGEVGLTDEPLAEGRVAGYVRSE